jgi:hypothetical protein
MGRPARAAACNDPDPVEFRRWVEELAAFAESNTLPINDGRQAPRRKLRELEMAFRLLLHPEFHSWRV